MAAEGDSVHVSALEGVIQTAEEAVQRQGDIVRGLKAEMKDGRAVRSEVDAAIEKLKNLKIDLEAKVKEYADLTGKSSGADKEAFRVALTNVLERRLFFIPSFKIYGSCAGFFDFGPPGCAIKQNIQQYWRQHFVLEENMLEVECPAVTPEVVLKASGHVERFTDFMVTDVETGDCHRADHLLEDKLEEIIDDPSEHGGPQAVKEARELLVRVGELGVKEIGAALTKYNIKAPETGNDISAPFPFNLMFKTSIGPKGDLTGYLRPETAQGIFVNFRDLLYYNGGRLPFAAAQIGNSYRNEISPRSGLLRVREFTQAEIEHFCHPEDKSHPKFASVSNLEPNLYSRALQMGEEKKPKKMSLSFAVSEGIIANETLAYFIGRTHQFCIKIGLNPDRVRFRQHLQHEMAHYAEDCWDCEVETSYGWIECAGLADRSAYDLKAHASASKVELQAYERYSEPKMEDVISIIPVKKVLGMALKKEAAKVINELSGMCEETALKMKEALDKGETVPLQIGDKIYDIEPSWVEIKKDRVKVNGKNFTPSVIEPSFGIGRFIYCMFEHCYYVRDGDERRTVFKFSPLAAPIKTTVFPLMARPDMNAAAESISLKLTKAGLSNTIDCTGTTIGKRYARTDEIGIPFAVTVDFETLDNGSVTVRDRDTTSQVRVPSQEITQVLKDLAEMELTWNEVRAKYPAQDSPDEE